MISRSRRRLRADSGTASSRATGHRAGLRLVLGMVAVGLAASSATFAAGPVFWDWPADRNFEELELAGTAVNSQGHLEPGLSLRPQEITGPEVVWRAVPDGKGGFYLGTGHEGAVHQVAADGQAALLADLDVPEVFSLLPLPNGDVLAGCGPDGELYRLRAGEEPRLVGQAPGGYIWALAARPGSDEVWLAVGTPASVQRYRPASEELSEVLVLEAQNALDLVFDDDGVLLIGTQGPGLVYSLDPDRPDAIRLRGEVRQDEVRQFLRGPEGRIHCLALSAPQAGNGVAVDPGGSPGPGLSQNKDNGDPSPGMLPQLGATAARHVPAAALYRLEPVGGGLVEHWSGGLNLMTAAYSPRWGWLAGGALEDDASGSRLHRLTPPAGHHPLAGWDGGDILDLVVTDDGARGPDVAAAQAHPGGLAVSIDAGPRNQMAVSPVLDGGGPVRWGRLRWEATDGRNRLHWSVRSGNRSQPDATWTAWSDAWSDDDQALDLPIGRYLQWRVAFAGDAAGQSRRVTAVSVSAWQENRAPVIEDFRLEQLRDVHLGGMMNGGQNVTQSFRSGLQVEFSSQQPPVPWPGSPRSALGRSVRIFTWQANDPNGDRLAFRLDYRPLEDDSWRPVRRDGDSGFPFDGGLGSWDTEEVADGRYEVRLTASDHPDNPRELATSSSRILGPLVVDNTPPEIRELKAVRTDSGFDVSLTAEDGFSVLAAARIILPDGSVQRLDPRDRICDSQREDFAATIAWPPADRKGGPQPWLVRVEVRDLGGNFQAEEVMVR